MEYLHRMNVVHRDIKPENILIHVDATVRIICVAPTPLRAIVTPPRPTPPNLQQTGTETIKVADFGWSVVMRDGSRRFTLCGTVEYLPPEVASDGEYGFGFDMWTVGVLMFEMLVGHSPFANPAAGPPEQAAIIAAICAGAFTMPPSLSPAAADLLSRLLVREADRASPAAVLAHPWTVSHVGAPAPHPEVAAVTIPCLAPWPYSTMAATSAVATDATASPATTAAASTTAAAAAFVDKENAPASMSAGVAVKAAPHPVLPVSASTRSHDRHVPAF